MKPTLFPGCKLYYFNRKKLEFGTIDEKLVEANFTNGIIKYTLIFGNDPNFLIVQALNSKKASAKFLTLIMQK